MTLTIEIPNQIYQKMEKIVTERTEPASDVLEKFINEKINDSFEAWCNQHNIYSDTSEDSLNVLLKPKTYPPAYKFDIW
ncbi:MAG: hypothetical protein HYZ54_03835 [Ignavibacteriae bacterium]|nr:hypothetical protein [Ignavibacteriota bacterium]